MSTCQLEFRSSERRRRYLLGPNYKHSTPNGVKPVLPLTGSINTPGRVRSQPKSCSKNKNSRNCCAEKNPNQPSLSVCLCAKKSDQALPFFSISKGAFFTVKSEILTPSSICCQLNGIDTVALTLARAVNTAARLLPRAFCIQST